MASSNGKNRRSIIMRPKEIHRIDGIVDVLEVLT